MGKLILCPDTTRSPDLTFHKTSCTDLIWENGGWIDTKKLNVSQLEFIFEKGSKTKMTDYAVSDMGCSIVSEQLKLFFESLAIDNIQYFKAHIIKKDKTVHSESYYVANIVGLIDCIDMEASEMDVDLDEDMAPIIYSIENLKLKECVLDKPIARLTHFTRVIRVILVDEKLMEKITEAKLTGIKLITPENWDGLNGEKRQE